MASRGTQGRRVGVSRSKKAMRWALLPIAALVAVLSVMAVPAGAQTPPDTQDVAPGETPLYGVKVHAFKAIDESGYDWSGSDEVFGYFASNRGALVRTSTYGDVDSGESRMIKLGERCLAPQHLPSGGPVSVGGALWAPDATWNCPSSKGGVEAPIELGLSLYEDDPCPFCFNGYAPYVPDENDDLIGEVDVSYSRSFLASKLPENGDMLVHHFSLGGPCGHQEPGEGCTKNPLSSSGPEYGLTIHIGRVNTTLDSAP
jgi:hypothetical protein